MDDVLLSAQLPDDFKFDAESLDPRTRKELEIQRKQKLAEAKAARRKEARRKKREAHKHKLRHPKWDDNCYGRAQEKVHYAFANTDRPLGRILNGIVISLVIFSVITFMVETMPKFYEEDPGHNTFFWMETGVVALFTVELGLRFWATPLYLKWEFCKNGLNIIDFLAIFPYYLELVVDTGVSGFQVIRIIRLARIMRLFKLPRFTAIVSLLRRGMIRGKEGLYLMIFFLFMSLILFGSIIYYAEGAEATWEEDVGDYGMWIYDAKRGGGESPFSSIPASIWWAVVTQTTVGYGDLFPVTPYGKTVAAISYIFAIIMMSYPVAILGEAFLEEYEMIKNETPTIVKRQRAILLYNHEELQRVVDSMEVELDRASLAWALVRASHERVRRSFLLFTPGKHSMTHAVFEALTQANNYQTSNPPTITLSRDPID